MAYNAKTNWDNEEKYLTGLMNTGSAGERAWAQNQLGQLNKAKSKYLGTTPAGFAGSATGVDVSNLGQNAVRDEMNQNSKDWYLAGSQAERDALHGRNQELAGVLGGQVNYNKGTGIWGGTSADKSSSAANPTFDLDSFMAAKPTYTSQYMDRINAMLDQILNRADFSYDANSDPLFQQYKATYNREGDRAMQDTMAEAAAHAGGMNSAAITAAAQANNYHAAQVADKIPELQQLAYSMYLADLNNDRADMSMLQSLEDTDYSRYMDSLGDWRNDLQFSYNQYRDDVGDQQWQTQFDYGVSRDQIADQRYDQEWEYNVGRDQIADQRYDQEWAYGVSRDEVEDAWRQKQWDYQVAQDQAAAALRAKSNSTSNTTYGDDVIVVAAAMGWSEKEAQALKNTGSAKWYEALEQLGISGGGAPEEETDGELPIDLTSMPIKAISPQGALDKVASGEWITYVEDGKRKFKVNPDYKKASTTLLPGAGFVSPLW